MGIRKFINHSIKFRAEINNSASECTFMLLLQWHAMYEFGKLDFVHYILLIIITKFAHVASEYSKVESPAPLIPLLLYYSSQAVEGRTYGPIPPHIAFVEEDESLVRHSFVPNTKYRQQQHQRNIECVYFAARTHTYSGVLVPVLLVIRAQQRVLCSP